MSKCNCNIRGIGPFNLAACVVIFSLYNMLSSTVELCAVMRKNAVQGGSDSVAAFNFFSSSFTIIAGALGVLSTVTKSHRFVLVVLVVAIMTMVCDAGELIANATSGAPSVFQFIMTTLHFLLNSVAMVVFLSYYRVLKKGGTGRERMSPDDFNGFEDASTDSGNNPLSSPKMVTEDTPLMA
ncbi:hypothetical protein, conserved [Eimeria acervulina]|uniref:Uncharacterized protein n=1 Tax=Eimeria acervulina TaxID=5801 RepID=U6GRK4_EIMAC|nr:hypothetical protein, conserved [Eimeria acervulina]CDI81888.1 hypothetical protein, conserved [Eimeria acervulina]